MSDIGLIVPIDLVSFCIGKNDETVENFTGATTDFSNQAGLNGAFLGSNVATGFDTPVPNTKLPSPKDALTQGVHLHWALPDGLTKASSDQNSILFKTVPNRWLVNRYVINGTTVQRKSWVVLSDLLGQAKSTHSLITLPVTPLSTSDKNFRYVGNVADFDAAWIEPVVPQELLFKTMTGHELCPVSNGEVSFACYYPNSRSIFGFYDDLSDLATSTATLMYQVIGWFSNLANDPIANVSTLDDLQKMYGWTLDNWKGAFQYSLYNGITQNVLWDQNKQYISNTTPNIDLDATIGNSPSEAISAFLRYEKHPEIPYFEQLLNAYQQGLLNDFKQPIADQLSVMEENLEENRFRSINGGYIYAVVQKQPDQGQEVDVEVTNLPIKLADDLNQLNLLAQQYQMIVDQNYSYRWQLFADWYRIFMADKKDQQSSVNAAFNKANGWTAFETDETKVYQAFQAQLDVVNKQLSPSQLLRQVPAPRYWQPLEPALLLSGSALPSVYRYGGDGRFNDKGYLVCRPSDQNLTSVAGNGKQVDASNFNAIALPSSSGLPTTAVFNALTLESCLLNTSILSQSCGSSITQQNLIDSILGSSKVISFQGIPPSPIGLTWWNENPWLPVFVHWNVSYLPLSSTGDGTSLSNYNENFFTTNYTIDQDSGGIINYTPTQGSGGIDIDPSKTPFLQGYAGSAILTSSPIKGFIKQLSKSSDETLKELVSFMEDQNVLVHTISGFNPCLLMKQQGIVLSIKSTAPYPSPQFSDQIRAIVGDANDFPPNFNSFYNPIRAGYLNISLRLIDVFGQVKNVNFSSFTPAESMTTYYKKTLENSITYMPPRISQPARLNFRWISANSSGYDEMNSHPATTPICGWILPNHLDGSLFLYNEQGESLGTIYLNGDQTKILWQSAPGNDATIDQTIEEVMENENAHLQAFALSLFHSQVSFFTDFYQSIDQIDAFIHPKQSSENNGIAVLIGRPLALAQVSLSLALQGSPSYNQSWPILGLSNPYAETDNDFTKVSFPIILGNLKKIDDGLIGYFKQDDQQAGYNFSAFYTKIASSTTGQGVVQPDQDNILLHPIPQTGQTSASDPKALQKILMVLDPRASIHATCGILPVKKIQIPSYMYQDTLQTLEMTFLTTPILEGNSGLSLPLPKEQGYEWSWVQEVKDKTSLQKEWAVNAEITPPSPGALWTYTPQNIAEGWLRLNPLLLLFNLLDSDNKPVVESGKPNQLTLKIQNTGRDLTFNPGKIDKEVNPKIGFVFYIHFGDMLNENDIPNVKFSASGWQFAPLNDDRYKNYWGATPTSPITLANGNELSIQVNLPTVSTKKIQTTVSFDYYSIGQINDGVYRDVLNVISNT